MSLFAGIDYSSDAIHIATIDAEGAYLARHRVDLKSGPGDSFDRARRVVDVFPRRGKWEAAGLLAVGIEATYSQAFKATVALARVQGAILACLPRDLVVIPIAANRRAPDGWKASTVGKTNASKDEVADWARANGCPPGIDQDFYDAYAIARTTALLWNTRRQPAALQKGHAA